MFFRKTVLDSGITVITEPVESVRSVSLGIWFAVGSRDESPAEAGMSHFMEHMLFKGTPTRDAKALAEEFDRMGAELNAGTSKEYTVYYARFLDQHLPTAFELLSDMVVNASFAQEECVKEREVVIEEIARAEDHPEDQVGDIFELALWPNHPIGLPVIGSRETVSTFDHDAAVAFRAKHFLTGNVVIAAAGNVEHDQIIALTKQWLADLPVGPRTPRVHAPSVGQHPIATIRKDTEQAHILLGMVTMDSRDEDRFALNLLNDVVGGGMSSRLFHKIREQLGLAYAVQSFPSLFQDTGMFAVYVGTRPENAQTVIDLITEEFESVASENITAEELVRAQESAAGHLALSVEATRTRMMRLGRSEISDNPVLSIDDVINRMNAVTLDDIRRVAGALLSAEKTLAVVGPFDDSDFAGFSASSD